MLSFGGLRQPGLLQLLEMIVLAITQQQLYALGIFYKYLHVTLLEKTKQKTPAWPLNLHMSVIRWDSLSASVPVYARFHSMLCVTSWRR